MVFLIIIQSSFKKQLQSFSMKMTAVVYPSPDLNCKKLCWLFTQTKLHHTATVNTLQNPLKIVLLSILST